MFRKILSTRYSHSVLVLSTGPLPATDVCRSQGLGIRTDLLWGVLVLWKFDHLPRHLVDRLDNLQHLVICDVSILVDIV